MNGTDGTRERHGRGERASEVSDEEHAEHAARALSLAHIQTNSSALLPERRSSLLIACLSFSQCFLSRSPCMHTVRCVDCARSIRCRWGRTLSGRTDALPLPLYLATSPPLFRSAYTIHMHGAIVFQCYIPPYVRGIEGIRRLCNTIMIYKCVQ